LSPLPVSIIYGKETDDQRGNGELGDNDQIIRSTWGNIKKIDAGISFVYTQCNASIRCLSTKSTGMPTIPTIIDPLSTRSFLALRTLSSTYRERFSTSTTPFNVRVLKYKSRTHPIFHKIHCTANNTKQRPGINQYFNP
jgi:hypothetical protein